MNTSIWDEIRDFFLRGSVLSRLIGINIAVFVVIGLIRVVFFLIDAPSAYDGLIYWLGVPSSFDILVNRPWTIITYMFLHFDFFHILFNMIMLYIGGRLFKEFLGENRMTGTYLIGGFIGALFFILAYNVFPVFRGVRHLAVAIGASASVLAIFIAIATYKPNYQLPLIIIGRIRLKYIAVFFVVIDLVSIDKGNPGGHLAHLGGALWGFLYVGLLKQGMDPGRAVGNWVKILVGVFRPQPRMKVHYRSPRPLSDDEYNRQKKQAQKHMDEILDKISKHGYDSLSEKEKEILFKFSNKE
jgi:membrane associated rhomboid family serine protease